MTSNANLERFKRNCDHGQLSVLTLAGTGPNGAAQLALLNAIGEQRLAQLKRIDVVSASVISYFLYSAGLSGDIKIDGFASYEQQARTMHKGSLLRMLRHTLSLGWRKRAYFSGGVLPCVFSTLFTAEFLTFTAACEFC